MGRLKGHRVICDRSGFERHIEDCRMEWNGMLVRASDWEPRHPQDFVRGVPDGKPVEIIRPDEQPVFVGMYGEEVKPQDL